VKIIPVLYPVFFRATLARREFLSTSRFQVWHSTRTVYPCQPPYPFSSPESGGRGPPSTGIGDRKQDQSSL
jgi:hypothetical protein